MITDEEIDAAFAKDGSDTIYGFARAIYQLGRQHQRESGTALPDVDRLANIIRFVDGGNSLGAGELAESIIAVLLASAPKSEVKGVMYAGFPPINSA